MGLLSRFSGAGPAGKTPGDDVLLMHGMLLMAGAEGKIEPAEIETVEAFFATLPEFAGKEFGAVVEQANKIVAQYGTLLLSVKALGGIRSPAVRKKCYVLAADIALASGEVDEAEDQMLDEMQRILGVDDAFATRTLEVLSTKHAR
jgi:uncharacterized tellurite resistance protein B-like protein